MTRTIGDIRIDRVIESEGPDFVAHELIPEATPAALAPHKEWLHPHFVDFASMKLVMAMQTYVLRHGRNVILVDTCVGNQKARRFHAPWNQRTSMAWLDNLAKAGVRVEDVTHVMCTHLHIDHVGWNTQLVDGRWVPTFPNARYVFARTEWEYFEGLYRKHGAKVGDGSFADSVLPIVEAGRADLVAGDYGFDGSLWFEPYPGHTPGHVAINLSSAGMRGVLSGDILHSPIQCAHPEWSTSGCSDKVQSAVSRRALLERLAGTDTLLMTAHFASPSAGFIERAGTAFRYLSQAETV
jgi:glyoxylase-like metal-dependent hydrolase (beta-lactamase superfamily II)